MDLESASSAPASIPSHGARHRYVFGSFGTYAAAERAIDSFDDGQAINCQFLLVSDTASGCSFTNSTTFVDIRRISGTGAIGPKLRDALSSWEPFATLGRSLNDISPASGNRPDMEQRLFQRLVHHLAHSATVLIVYAPTPSAQIGASRALLDAGCDVLLTHEFLDPSGLKNVT